MSFIDSIRTCFGKYVTFSGRASRSEFWKFWLFFVLGNFLLILVHGILFGPELVESAEVSVNQAGEQSQNVKVIHRYDGGWLSGIFDLLTLPPLVSAAWRRMHDTGRGGFLVLLPGILIVGAVLILIFGIGVADLFASGGSFDILFTRLTLLIVIPTLLALMVSPLLMVGWLTRPSQPGANTYGPNPNEVPT